MARPKTRHADARRFSIWLAPEDYETLRAYQAVKGLSNRTEAIQAILKGVHSWLAKGQPIKRTKPARSAAKEENCPEMEAASDTLKPDEEFDEYPDDLAEDTGPDCVPRTAGGIEIEPDCPEMAALED